MRRRPYLFIFATLWCLLGAQYRTTNFVVHAQTAQIAQQVGQLAEQYRKEKSLEWLGLEMPTWPQPCPLHVTVSMEGPSGATSFNFGMGKVMGMKMEIQGPLDRLLASVLPHEITHTVFAHHFRCPVPRWADEGGSVLSEDDIERDRHDKLTRQILNQSQQIPLRRLFGLKEYPRQVMCLYAQGYSMADYLVKRSDRRTFLQFIGHGMHYGWDGAVQSFYGHKNVEELEETWLQYLRDTKGQSHLLARIDRPRGQTPGTMVRMTAPPIQPLDPEPVIRGQAPTPDQVGLRFGDQAGLGWQPVQPMAPAAPVQNAPTAPPIPVRLGPPQFGPPNGQPLPNQSPVGFPR